MAKYHKRTTYSQLSAGAALVVAPLAVTFAGPVPGFVAPVTQAPVAEYVDDTRGLFIPPHMQLRGKTEGELANWQQPVANPQPQASAEDYMSRLATGVNNPSAEIDRIGQSSSPLEGGMNGAQMAQAFAAQPTMATSSAAGTYAQPRRAMPQGLEGMPSLATGGQARMAPSGEMAADLGSALPMAQAPSNGGQEIAIGGVASAQSLDLQNGIVRLKEERITVRRALQRMLDQVGGAGWTVVWDLDEVNVALPEMEISLYTEEPFKNVLNALLARLQSRSGQPLRVIKYDQTQRLVITDRAGDASTAAGVGPGSEKGGKGAAVTETVLKEARVSLHYDEVPLVDALENMVNQAGKGQWRLRMYAGTDQVLKPAHIEEPFGVAVERVLKVFNLRYEIFPGGKLVVVTGGDSFGFRGVQ